MLCHFCNKDLFFETRCMLCDKKVCRDCRNCRMSQSCKGWKCRTCLSPNTIVYEQKAHRGCEYCGGSGLDWQSSRDAFVCCGCNGGGTNINQIVLRC